MARKHRSRSAKPQPQNGVPDDDRPAGNGASSAAEKGPDEAELEKLVFGDLEGFQEGLRLHDDDDDASSSEDEAHSSGGDEDLAVGPAKDQDLAALQDDELFILDTGTAVIPRPATPDSDNDDDAAGKEDGADEPAWHDSDDERMTVSLASHARTRKLRDTAADDLVSGLEYSRRLRAQFERIYPIPEWALPPKPKRRRRSSASSSSSSSSDGAMDVDAPSVSAPPLSALLQTAGGYTTSSFSSSQDTKAGKPHKLRPEILDIARLADANAAAPSLSGIQSLSFHPTHPLLLTAGFDSTLRLYHIDGKHNPRATALHIRSTPIHTAQMHADGRRVFAAGRRRYFHVWDLETGAVDAVTRVYAHQHVQKSMERFELSPSGRYLALVGARGTVQVLDATTSQWVASAKVEGRVADIAWWQRERASGDGGETLSILTKQAEVFEYSPATKAVVARWTDHGGVAATVIANSPNGRWVAVGEASGIVNVYDRRGARLPADTDKAANSANGAAAAAAGPTLVRSLDNLVTSISAVVFAPDSQVLCVASRAKRDALRLVHLPSVSVFKNWPTSATPLGRVTSVAFAPGKRVGVLAVGNEGGKVRLFEIR